MMFGAGFVFLFFVVFTAVAHAQVSIDFPTSFAGFSSQDLKTTIENIVRIVLGFIGIIFLVLMLYGGFVWMTSGGDEKKISQAKKIIVSATVGLIITLASYAIASFIVNRIGGATQNGPVGGGGGPGGFGFALGAGVLQSHYPGRNATGVPRNAKIFVTFKEPIKLDTICDPGPNGTLGDSDDEVQAGSASLEEVNGPQVTLGCATTNNLTFKFTPGTNLAPALLGNSSGDTRYTVVLTNQIVTAANKTALPLSYSWQFTVSNIVDTTPPTVVDVVPLGPPVAQGGSAVPRNSVVQITFSEAVDPTTVSGIYDGAANTFDTIQLDDDGAVPYLSGSYSVSNQYRTVEFVTNAPCGVNSCGLDVFCLPAKPTPPSTITGTIKTAGTNPVADMAGNILDGEFSGTLPSGDGTSGGDFVWSFDTDPNLDLTPPFLIGRVPAKQPLPYVQGVSLTDPLELTFSERLSSSSVRPGDSVYIASPTTNYWLSVDSKDWNGTPASIESKIYVHHDRFTALTQVDAGVNSTIKDIYQNCYFPAACDNNGDGALTVAGDDTAAPFGTLDHNDCSF
ncbi:MAG: Ig-like domain-containing protein [Candidatus Komeilibacteria bacterium]|nr:Ig-like domain-containing protein [Candidatus Komeilibacteria bacterium]